MMSALLNYPLQNLEFNVTADLLPTYLVRLSSESLSSKLSGKHDPLDSPLCQGATEVAFDEDLTISLDLSQFEIEPVPIRPWSKPCPVVAVDVSSIGIGETVNGVLCALRGAVVWRKPSRYMYSRCGPLIFHLTDRTIQSIFQRLGFPSALSVSSVPLVTRALARLRNVLERWVQRSVCQSFEKSLVLLDGSLTAGTPDNPAGPVQAMLKTARDNENAVLAISKSTKLRFMRSEITRLTDGFFTACLIDVDYAVRGVFPSCPVQLLGRIFVVKLSQNGFSFRLDIDADITRDCAIESIRRLVRSDVVDQGYPETLRLAHILSTFTANEVVGIQRFLSRRYGLKAEPPLNLRRSLFGPYGLSWGAS